MNLINFWKRFIYRIDITEKGDCSLNNKKYIDMGLVIGITFLFAVSSASPMIQVSDGNEIDRELLEDVYIFDRIDDSPQSKSSRFEKHFHFDRSTNNHDLDKVIEEKSPPIVTSNGLMDSPWPMKCHDLRHTAQSPYSTENNTYTEIWRFKSEHELGGTMESSAVIGDDGTIYFGTMGTDHKLYAVNPDGTKKWSYEVGLMIWSTPAIAEDGTIYVTSYDGYLHALYSNNGTLKWKKSGSGSLSSSPAVGEDGTIYFGAMGPYEIGRIWAINPDGTEKWHYDTGFWIVSDPAVGEDGTIYIGCSDNYLYAMNPNGTLKWRFETEDDVKAHPSIAEDGTIYISSWDDYLYAIYPNGTMKWKTNTGWGSSGSAAIADDGTIYLFTDIFRAFYPDNGAIKWSLDIGDDGGHTSPAISSDGIIYTSNDDGKCIIAIDLDGNEIWRKQISNLRAESSPIIGEDGTIYVGSSWKDDEGNWFGYLHSFGTVDSNNPPEMQELYGPLEGEINTFYEYSFYADDPDNNPVGYFVDWGDGSTSGWTMDYAPGVTVSLWHEWSEEGNYTIKVKARDSVGEESDWMYLEVTMPVNQQQTSSSFFMRFLDRFPNAFPIFRHLLRL